MTVVMEASDGALLDSAAHPLDPAIGPGLVRLGEAVFDVVYLADHVEARLAREGGVPVSWLTGELDAVVGEGGGNARGHGFE